ncbi:hypothetical protein Pan14r_28700 [Crateriforma conspicua]|uniref:Uncharacterized protein n=2 Tax=Crateriforma conspicua TaxID=2527996 RepID=A0A5C5Y721_9PLAN|nr:hypothetical protein Mal65_43360 [Crateriforma conspicua]TWT70563.1 hypothetical protein Pan14r_28700 [Crateriforma conspicua]
MYPHPASAAHLSTYMYSRAAATPVVDASGVYAFFESEDFLGLDWSGQPRWHRNEADVFGQFGNNHDIGSSPAADDHSLYRLIEHDGPSSLVSISRKPVNPNGASIVRRSNRGRRRSLPTSMDSL